jgi:hypothetical protein
MRDQKTSNRDSGLTAPTRIGSGDLLGRDWWPLCAKCGKIVDNLEPVPLPANPDKFKRAIRDYIVTCHGETEKHIVGIWAAYEIASQRKRLPDAFKRPNDRTERPEAV